MKIVLPEMNNKQCHYYTQTISLFQGNGGKFIITSQEPESGKRQRRHRLLCLTYINQEKFKAHFVLSIPILRHNQQSDRHRRRLSLPTTWLYISVAFLPSVNSACPLDFCWSNIVAPSVLSPSF